MIDSKVRFSPVLEGLSGPEYMHWMLGPFTDFPVSAACLVLFRGPVHALQQATKIQAWLVSSSGPYCLQKGATCLA